MSDLTRLEYFAAAALTGLLAGDTKTVLDPAFAAEGAVHYAQALAEEIDRQFGVDAADPDAEVPDA